jgi:hypothetical protein
MTIVLVTGAEVTGTTVSGNV